MLRLRLCASQPGVVGVTGQPGVPFPSPPGVTPPLFMSEDAEERWFGRCLSSLLVAVGQASATAILPPPAPCPLSPAPSPLPPAPLPLSWPGVCQFLGGRNSSLLSPLV